MAVWQATCRFSCGGARFDNQVLARSDESGAFLASAGALAAARGWSLDGFAPLAAPPRPCTDPALIGYLGQHEAALLTPAGQPMAHVTRLTGIEPLDAQFGRYPKRDLPEALEPWIFGAGGRFCYALLDGARVAQLPGMLAGSLLEHASLFQGKAQADMAEVAPYLVRLEPSSPFTRRLFTRPGVLGGLWGQEGGVLLLSDAPLADLRKQLRKYTRIQGDGGKWFYFRFWEPRVFRANLSQYDAATMHAFLGPVEAALCPGADEDEMLIFETPPQTEDITA
ncbi:MAG: DUF4123 domain-containing protein [Paracoccus sp. (in: a-proteobacteria)]|nr:DUF4123 domain-containing protein [Paracoccus sp. (in: a-proteobacteria)]